MTAFALLFTLSAIGISETAYLIRKRIAAERPICLIGQDCTAVLSSKYNHSFGIPNDVLGLFFYLASAVLGAFLVIGVEPTFVWGPALIIAVAGASMMSLFFTYLQWKVIRAWCFWCLMSACTIWLMGGIIVLNGLRLE